MKAETFTFKDGYGKKLYGYKWTPSSGVPKGIVQLVHGIMEYGGRYEYFAEQLTAQNYVVYTHDHQGHGYTDPDHLGYIDSPDGFTRMSENIYDLFYVIRNSYPELPLVLAGHSMGAALVLRSLQLYQFHVDALICSGLPAKPPLSVYPGYGLASLLARLFGEKNKSPFLFKMIFGPYQKPFEPGRTHMDWLSRDIYNIDTYLNHPFCGFVSSYALYRDLLVGLIRLYKSRELDKLSSDLPVYLLGGSADPVCKGEKGLRNTERLLRESGVYSVSVKTYENGRHEMLRETNRQQVISDTISWMNQTLALK